MEEDREILKHSCKLCNKSFPCGRSLGGHMRSHMINNNNSADVKFPKKKLPSVSEMAAAAASYSLRENPKKTRRLADTSGDETPPLLPDKACNKESVKGKTLFGSMEKETNGLEEDQDSWTGANSQKLVMDSQSDNETAAPNRRRRRSKRRTRYMATANSSSFSNNNNNVSSSVSEIEQEQEEVAMCLMMLSRDLGGGPRVCLNSVAESSDNNSVFLEAKVDDAGDKRCQFDDETQKNSELDQPQLGGSKKLVSDAALKNNNSPTIGFKDSSHKRSKFECTTCNKIFHSYQALGGHRASHKKIKGCFSTKIDSNENSIETQQLQLSPDPTADSSKVVKSTTNDNSIDHLVAADCEEKFYQTSTTYGPKKRHECPICLKVFSSGQALGGHKRSHVLNVTDQAARSNSSTIVNDKPMPEIRNFLDLNLPAPAEEESSNGHLGGFKPWWIDSSHKHEALVGLISN